MDQIIADGKYISDEVFWNYFKYHTSFLAKDLIRAEQVKNEQVINNINEGLINLRNTIINIDIVERILDFNKQQKGEGIKILTSKRMP